MGKIYLERNEYRYWFSKNWKYQSKKNQYYNLFYLNLYIILIDKI